MRSCSGKRNFLIIKYELMFEKLFSLKKNQTNIRTEILAGATTNISYIPK